MNTPPAAGTPVISDNTLSVAGKAVHPVNTPSAATETVHSVNTPSAATETVRSVNTPSAGETVNSVNTGAYLISTLAKGIVHIPPGELAVHSDLLEVAELNAQEQAQLKASIEKEGRVVQPLIINSAKQVLDGRHRLVIALLLGLLTVPVIVDDRVDAVDLAISSALDRRQLDEGQRSLYVFKLHRVVRQDRAGAKPDEKLRGKAVSAFDMARSEASYEQVSFRQLALRYGVPHQYFTYLNQMWNNSTAEEWAQIVSKIESGESPLKQQYKGFQSRVLTKGQARTENPERQIKRGSSGFFCVGRHWASYSTDVQNAHEQEVKEGLPEVDPAYIARLHKIYGEYLSKLETQS